jgi:hypothetical protein
MITQDWRWRMITPPRGDYQSVPINQAAYQSALKWDPAQDEASGQQCRAFGAAGLMRLPGRLHISWQDDNTLLVQTDAGMQSRMFHFGNWRAPPDEAASWQGDSVARWEIARPAMPFGAAPGGGARGAGGRGGAGPPPGPGGPRGGSSMPRFGSLRVETTHLLSGYLRTNGVPYSEQTRLVEYWDATPAQGSGQPQDVAWITITSDVHDPVYLQSDWITALNFKHEPDGSKWDPQPCTARW